MIVHLVLLRLKPDLSVPDVLAFARSLSEICRRLPAVKSAWVGPRKIVDAGYTRSLGDMTYNYAAVLHFESQDELLCYLRDPLHAEVGRRFWEICEATVVFEGELVDLKVAELPDNWSITQ
jgi:hypothetical protein